MYKKLFVKNAAILTVTSILLRSVGIFFRVYISNKIGSEGMGLHQLIFSVYTFASAIASSSISTAVTRLVSENAPATKKSAKKILSRAFAVSILLSFAAASLMFFLAEFISERYLGDMRAALSLKILSFGLPFMAVSSCLKGYFLARRKTSTPSGSQIFEQAVRIAAVMALLSKVPASNLKFACGAVVTGNALSEVAACIYIYIGYLKDISALPKGTSEPANVFRSLFHVFVPLAMSSYLASLLHTIENIIVPDALMRHTLSRERSLSQFGLLKAMALPLIFFPASFLGSVSALLLPEVAQNKSNSKSALKNTIRYTMLITSVSSILASLIFIIYANEIGYIVYRSNEVGYYIGFLAPLIPFMYIESITAGILSGLDLQASALKYSLIDSALRTVLVIVFVPKFGIKAFLIIMAISNIFTSTLNTRRLFVAAYAKPEIIKWFIKPLIAAVLSAVCIISVKPLLDIRLSPIVSTASGIMIICIVYCAFILLFKCITREDFAPLLKRRKENLC